MKTPYRGTDEEAGVRVAKVAPDRRTAAGSCNATGHVKAKPRRARSVRSRAYQESRGVQMELEAKTLLRRKRAMEQAGIDEIEATGAALAMFLRDRPDSGDDRRVCFECKHLKGSLCKSKDRFAMHVVTQGNFEPVRTLMQRCEGFQIRGEGSKSVEVVL